VGDPKVLWSLLIDPRGCSVFAVVDKVCKSVFDSAVGEEEAHKRRPRPMIQARMSYCGGEQLVGKLEVEAGVLCPSGAEKHHE
jgi:hypothetical protein